MAETEKSKRPTRKWLANAVAVVSGWVIALIQNEWDLDAELQITGVGIFAGLVGSYLLSNEGTPGGVPRKRRR